MDNTTSTKSEGKNNLIKVVLISDTHGKHRELDSILPDGDILIHAGDFSMEFFDWIFRWVGFQAKAKWF